jgi:hypothetical protein
MLDCLTDKGLVYMRHQRETEEIIRRLDYTVISFHQDDCPIDVLIARDNKLCAVGEIKCRDKAGSVKLTNEYIKQNDYLITREKLEKGLQIGKLFGVPYYVIVNVLNEKNLLIWNVDKFKSAVTKTQSTCNGGVSYRENAFLKFEDAYLYKYE